jgi:serine/threonine-protein kinase
MSLESPAVDPGPEGAAGSNDGVDVEVARVLEAYLAAVEAGQPADPRRLLESHPHLAGQLRACLRVLQVAERAAREVTDAPGVLPGRPVAAPPQGSGTGLSWLSTLDFGPGEPPHVQLREPADDREPLLKPRSPEMPAPGGASLGRYQLQGEIARGGMGAVLKGRDVDLGRDLAIKVLLESHRGNPDVVRRFVEEAQIGGQLQHPGVVPVYELGRFADRRPFFTMKLVKGQTLAALLQDSTSPAEGLPRFLSIFEQVCQTMAYAHARGVIHRDLKPSNIMVGSFGEVQVMDWGLAKVLARGGIADEAADSAEPLGDTVIMTVRTGPAGSGSESQAGSVLGTPAYMAPEQARGDVDRLDERADVFGLGAILCEILTGRPPFGGSTREEVRAKAARGDLTGARRRLDTCDADAELIGLARDCLAPEPEERPRNAGEVARRMSAYQAGVQDRLKAAERARIEAQTRAEEAQARAAIERSRRWRTVALAASVLGSFLLVGGGWAYLARQRLERVARIERVSSGVEALYAEANRAGDDPMRWVAAREAARALDVLLAEAPDANVRSRLTLQVREVALAVSNAEADQKLLDQLTDIRTDIGDDRGGMATDERHADAFREAGLDLESLSPTEAAVRIRARPATIRAALVAALDYWAAVRGSVRHDPVGARRLFEIARLADPDPWRNRLRAVAEIASRDRQLGELKELARSARDEELPAVSLQVLGASLIRLGDPVTGEAVLRDAALRYPGDLWVNYELAQCLEGLGRREEAIRYYMAMRSLRPETAHRLAHLLATMGETTQAIALFRDMARRRPSGGAHLTCLGEALKDCGRTREALTVLDEAISAARAVLAAQPSRYGGHFVLAKALLHRGNLDEAITEFREALRIEPEDPEVRLFLGAALVERGELREAIAEYRTILHNKPDHPAVHTNLGVALFKQGDWVASVSEFRAELRVHPGDPFAHRNLAIVLRRQGKLDEAITEYRAAVRSKPDLIDARNDLALALEEQGKLDEAVTEYRAAIRLAPDAIAPHHNLGVALRKQGKLDEAVAELRSARELAHGAKSPLAPKIERVLTATEQLALRFARLPAVLANGLGPADATDAPAFALLCYYKELHGASARFWAEAFQSRPKLADDMRSQHRYNAACVAALAGCGQGKDDPPLDGAAKARWRRQALDWLKADLAAWSKLLASGPPQARQSVAQTLQHWKADPDLSGLRDPAARAKLPEDEQKACRSLWADVDALLAKSRGGMAP